MEITVQLLGVSHMTGVSCKHPTAQVPNKTNQLQAEPTKFNQKYRLTPIGASRPFQNAGLPVQALQWRAAGLTSRSSSGMSSRQYSHRP
jgi:hypothetical protein